MLADAWSAIFTGESTDDCYLDESAAHQVSHLYLLADVCARNPNRPGGPLQASQGTGGSGETDPFAERGRGLIPMTGIKATAKSSNPRGSIWTTASNVSCTFLSYLILTELRSRLRRSPMKKPHRARLKQHFVGFLSKSLGTDIKVSPFPQRLEAFSNLASHIGVFQ